MKPVFILLFLTAITNAFAQDVFPFEDTNGKYGFRKRSGKNSFVYIPGIYESIGPGSDSIYAVATGVRTTSYGTAAPSNWGLLNLNTKKFISLTIYDHIRQYFGDVAVACKNAKSIDGRLPSGAKWGLLDRKGKEVFAFKYDLIIDFVADSIAPFNIGGNIATAGSELEIGGKWGYINTKGKEVVQAVYDYAGRFIRGYSNVIKSGKYGLMNSAGKETVPCMYEELSEAKMDYKVFLGIKAGKIGGINGLNQILIPFIYDKVIDYKYEEEILVFEKGGQRVEIDCKKLEVVIAPEPFETNFQKAFSKAATTKARAQVFSVFLNDVYLKVDTATFSKLVNHR